MSIDPGFKPAIRLASLTTIVTAAVAFALGYYFPRDLELQSLAPVEFRYEVTPESAKYLLLRDAPKCEVFP
jgi:hypothetical protein